MNRLVHTFSFFLRSKTDTRGPRVFQRRDAAALQELLKGFRRIGVDPGESLANPPPLRAWGPEPPDELLPVDLSRVRMQDLVLVATRLPIDDFLVGYRKRVERGYTDLEQCIFDVAVRFLVHSTRLHVRLDRCAAGHLRPGFEGMADMEFREAQCAPLHSLNAGRGRGARKQDWTRDTACYLLRVESIWEGGPGLVCAFGMDGASTLAWAHRLGQDLFDLLAEPRFLVARVTARTPGDRETSLRWAQDWRFEVALDMPLGDCPPLAHTPEETRRLWKEDRARAASLRRACFP